MFIPLHVLHAWLNCLLASVIAKLTKPLRHTDKYGTIYNKSQFLLICFHIKKEQIKRNVFKAWQKKKQFWRCGNEKGNWIWIIWIFTNASLVIIFALSDLRLFYYNHISQINHITSSSVTVELYVENSIQHLVEHAQLSWWVQKTNDILGILTWNPFSKRARK